MTRILGKLLIVFCVSILIGICLSLWKENQTWKGNYDRCIEVVTMYKNYVER